MVQVRRRQFLIGTGALLAASLAHAQQANRPHRIAFLPDFSPGREYRLKLFVETLRELGRVEGRDYVFYRSGVRDEFRHDVHDADDQRSRALRRAPTDLVEQLSAERKHLPGVAEHGLPHLGRVTSV